MWCGGDFNWGALSIEVFISSQEFNSTYSNEWNIKRGR